MPRKTPPVEYRGYLISRQRSYGPLGLLKWTNDHGFIVTRGGANMMPQTVFQTEADARRVIDLYERFGLRPLSDSRPSARHVRLSPRRKPLVS
jgi:hypothetical protein